MHFQLVQSQVLLHFGVELQLHFQEWPNCCGKLVAGPVRFSGGVCSVAGGCSGRAVAGPVRFSGGVCSVAGGCSGRAVAGPVRFSGGVCSVAGGCSGWLVLF